MSRLVSILLLGTLLCACTADGYFSHIRSFNPDCGWAYTDTVSFKAERRDTVSTGRLSVFIRHNNTYRYSNLWLEIGYNGRVDTVDLKLADPYGRWTGKGFGADYQSEVEIATHTQLSASQPVTLRHIMRLDTLRGIVQAGVAFEPDVKVIETGFQDNQQ